MSARGIIQRGDEGDQGLPQSSAESAIWCNDAAVARRKTFDEREVWFRYPQCVVDPDRLWPLSEGQPSHAATHRLEIPRPRKEVGDLHQMSAENVIDLGSLLDRDKPTLIHGSVKEEA